MSKMKKKHLSRVFFMGIEPLHCQWSRQQGMGFSSPIVERRVKRGTEKILKSGFMNLPSGELTYPTLGSWEKPSSKSKIFRIYVSF